MNFRPHLSLFVVFAICFAAACARKEKAVVDLSLDEKVIEVNHGEIKLEETGGKDIATAQQSSQTAPQKMGDNSEITVMYDGFGNKLERRSFKGHPRLATVIVRTAADGRREISVYGQNGARKSIEGEIVDRVLTASADEIANAAKIYETRPDIKNQTMPTVTAVQTNPVQPQMSVPMPVTLPQPQAQEPPPPQQPVTVQEKQTKVEEQVKETWEERDSTANPGIRTQKAEVKVGKKEGREDR
jgi:hypothetical protein